MVTDKKIICRGVRCTHTHESKQFAASRSKCATSHFLTVFLFKSLDKNFFSGSWKISENIAQIPKACEISLWSSYKIISWRITSVKHYILAIYFLWELIIKKSENIIVFHVRNLKKKIIKTTKNLHEDARANSNKAVIRMASCQQLM